MGETDRDREGKRVNDRIIIFAQDVNGWKVFQFSLAFSLSVLTREIRSETEAEKSQTNTYTHPWTLKQRNGNEITITKMEFARTLKHSCSHVRKEKHV